MAQASNNQTVGDLVSSTLQNTRQEVADNICKKSVYIAKLVMAGKKKSDEGGTKIVRSVEYALNGTVTSFNGYDQVPIVPQETVTDTIWDWKEYAGNWVISRRESRLNAGSKTRIRDLALQKKNSLEKSFTEQLNGAVLAPVITPGNGGKDLTSLAQLVSTTAVTVGGIADSTNNWANQRKTAGTVNATAQAGSAFINELRSFVNTCSQNSDGSPNFGLWGKNMFESYMAVLDTKVRYGSTEMANIGFRTIMLDNMEVTWDQIVPQVTKNTSTIVAPVAASFPGTNEEVGYFLNTDFLYLIVDTGTDFVFTPAVNHEPNGQYATSGSLLFMGEHICTNRRACGVYRGFNNTSLTLTT